jgi:hypothetical protein
MDTKQLEGTELPSGEYTVEGWKAFLWADATRNENDEFRYDEAVEADDASRQLVPYSMCHYIAFEATGGIEETMNRISDDWQEGAALGQLRTDLHSPIMVDEPYHVSGHISNVEHKEGSTGGLTIVTQSYEVTTTDDEPVYDMEIDMVLMEDQ